LVISLACVLPSALPDGAAPTLDPNTVGTAIMQTMAVALTQTSGAVPVGMLSSPTFTPEPTLSPTVTLTPTPLLTATPLVPLISVSVATNCRVGPGQAYERVGALLVGDVTEVNGRDPTGRYWFVRNPDRSNQYCWLWGEYATVVGNASALPIYTPPPTPTPVPGFDANYVELETCAGWWVNIQLTNTSGIAFKSIALAVRDTDTGDDVSMYADRFTAVNDCVGSTTEDILNPGETLTVSSPAFAYEPRGHRLRATITLCTATGQNGTCVTQVIRFSP
jgi:hypothetical protein